MRLWQRVALVVGVVSVSTLLFTGVVAIWVAGSSATRTADLAQERDVLAVAKTVDRWLADQGAFLTGWALAFDLASLDAERQAGLTRAVVAAMPSTELVILIDGDGQPVGEPASVKPVESTRLQALIDTLPVTAALESPEGFAFGNPTNRRTVPVAVVASRNPPLLVAAELRLEIAEELEARTGPDHALVLVDANRRPFVGGDTPLLNLDLVDKILGNVARAVSYSVGDKRVRGAVAPVQRTGWSVVILESEALALDGAQRIQRLLPVVVGLAMLLAGVMGLVLAQSVTEPIARLRDSALSLAEGRFGTTTEINRSDEVGELARAFDHLSRNLAENQAEILRQREEIEAFNHELQDRVAAATDDLRQAQSQLVRAGQLAAVAQMGAGLAHELNNPLTAVLGLTQVLKNTPQPDPDDLLLLEKEALRCRGVVDAMVRMSDVDEVGPTPVRRLQADIQGALLATLKQRRVELVWGTLPDLDLAAGPGNALRALTQLISALAAGLPTGSTIRVEAEQIEDWAMLRFFSSDSIGVERDDWMASGLDLWLARQALDQLGAQLVEPLEEDGPWQVRWDLG